MLNAKMFSFLLITAIFSGVTGCGQRHGDYALNKELARSSVEDAMKAWSDGKKPEDLQPKIVISDVRWKNGEKLVSFEIVSDQEYCDGSNLYIRVKRKITDQAAKDEETAITYVVGTSPRVTIFPQE